MRRLLTPACVVVSMKPTPFMFTVIVIVELSGPKDSSSGIFRNHNEGVTPVE